MKCETEFLDEFILLLVFPVFSISLLLPSTRQRSSLSLQSALVNMQVSGGDAKFYVELFCTKYSQVDVCLKLVEWEDELPPYGSVTTTVFFTSNSWHTCFILCRSRLQRCARTLCQVVFPQSSGQIPGRYVQLCHTFFEICLCCFTTHSLNHWTRR
jgi:hypothetical protein